MTAATVGDRWGRRRVFASGLVLFALASVACALAPNVDTLIAARAVQGAGAAVVMPLAMALLSAAFPPPKRGKALRVFSGITGLVVLGGPVVGGAVTQGLAWQWIFWINVPIELVWGLVRGNSAGWSSPEVLDGLVGGVVLLAIFARYELRADEPTAGDRRVRGVDGHAGVAELSADLGAAANDRQGVRHVHHVAPARWGTGRAGDRRGGDAFAWRRGCWIVCRGK